LSKNNAKEGAKLKKIWAFLIAIALALIMVGTANLCSASTPPILQTPENNKVVAIDYLAFSWTAAVPPPGDTVNYYWLEANYSYGVWGDIAGNSAVLYDATFTISKQDLNQFVFVEHLDVIQWRVGVFYVLAMFPQYSEIRSFNVLKTPACWVDNNSWEAFISTSNNSLGTIDYQTYLDRCIYGSPGSGYWEPFNTSNTINTIPITISSTPQLRWTDWSDDNQQTPVHFADYYRIQLSNSSTFGSLIIDTTTNNITYTTPELSPGAYYWRVMSERNDSLVTDWSSPRKFIIASSEANTAPQNLQASAGNGQVSLTWSASASNGGSAITNYKIYRGTTSGGETLLTTVNNELTYIDASVTNGLKYYYQVGAVNSNGESPKSNEVNVTPIMGATMVPSAPQNLLVTPGNGQVSLSWSAPISDGGSAITNYKIYRGTTSGAETLLTTVGNVSSYTDMTVTNNQPYYYKVVAVNSVGEGAKPNTVSATPSTAAGTTTASGNAFPSWLLPLLVIVIIIAVVGVVAFILIRKPRTPHGPTQKNPQPQQHPQQYSQGVANVPGNSKQGDTLIYCPGCGMQTNGSQFCGTCGRKLK